ncbi:mitochondrial import inner membrane translocase subunit Tim9 isoform X1 [Aptenodytes patagonicus]|uniref:mitochondrial import inner membrane translocase subunit Tim9 isoform X1 n=1 Tax=Aptenodytes patagonicus TaxID=9234 RepID=UPI003F9F9D3C
MAGQISESDQIKQFKEFLGTYNKLTENCFLDCIKDFTSREVKPEESVHRKKPTNQSQVLLMLDHQLQKNYGLGPLEVLSLSSFQHVHTEGISPVSL